MPCHETPMPVKWPLARGLRWGPRTGQLVLCQRTRIIQAATAACDSRMGLGDADDSSLMRGHDTLIRAASSLVVLAFVTFPCRAPHHFAQLAPESLKLVTRDWIAMASTQSHPQGTESASLPSEKKRRLVIGSLVGLAMALALGVAELSRQKRRHDYQVLVRNTIEQQIAELVGSGDILRLAARQFELSPGNAALAVCLYGLGQCSATDPERQLPFALRNGMEKTAPLLIGTDDRPSHFLLTGELVADSAPVSSADGWTTRAWFWAECDGGAPNCRTARRLHVRYQVLPLTDQGGVGATPSSDSLARSPLAQSRAVEVSRL